MPFHRPEPLRAQPVAAPAGEHAYRDASRALPATSGSLACPRCDAPVSLCGRVASLAEDLACPFCAHRAAVHLFLSLAKPTRPAHVRVRARFVVRESGR